MPVDDVTALALQAELWTARKTICDLNLQITQMHQAAAQQAAAAEANRKRLEEAAAARKSKAKPEPAADLISTAKEPAAVNHAEHSSDP